MTDTVIDREHLLACLALSTVEMPPRPWLVLVERFGSPQKLLSASALELESLPIAVSQQARDKVADAAGKLHEMQAKLDKLESMGVSVVCMASEDYPPLLKQIPDPPGLLYVRGGLEEVDRFGLAIVGSRKPRPYGQEVARRLAADLAAAGITIVSGGARGIDSVAHDGALTAGGRTIAVLGSGIDNPYPSENKALFDRIAESGAVVTEFPPGASPEPWRFPRRNRIISGLSRGVIVCDAAEDSGSLITASCAAEQNRDVFAVPGNVDAESSRGAHKLIKEGARLVESAEDVLSEYGLEKGEGKKRPVELPVLDLSPGEMAVLKLLDLDPISLDNLIEQSGMQPNEVAVLLTFLEMKNLVKRMPGPSYVRVLR